MVCHVTSDAQYANELGSAGDRLVVVDFFATWCGPCRMLEPVFASLEARYPAACFLKVDVDQCRSTAATAGVRAMPTIQLYRRGTKVGEVVGADPAAIERLIQSNYAAFESFSGAPRKLTDTPVAAAPPSCGGDRGGAAAVADVGQKTDGEAPGSHGECEVQVRLADGATVRGRFNPDDTLASVKRFVAGAGGGDFKLMLPGVPRRVYTEADMARTLAEEQLVPRAQLFVCK